MSEKPEMTADVIVIGSGAGGGFMATELAQKGLSALLLERGRWFDFTKDFPARNPDWEKRGSPFRTGSFFSFQPSISVKAQPFRSRIMIYAAGTAWIALVKQHFLGVLTTTV